MKEEKACKFYFNFSHKKKNKMFFYSSKWLDGSSTLMLTPSCHLSEQAWTLYLPYNEAWNRNKVIESFNKVLEFCYWWQNLVTFLYYSRFMLHYIQLSLHLNQAFICFVRYDTSVHWSVYTCIFVSLTNHSRFVYLQ